MFRSCLPLLLALAAHAAEPVVDWNKVNPEALQHYQAVVRINTSDLTGNETSVVNYLKSVLDRDGIAFQVFAREPNRANLVARLKGNGRKKPILILAHTDTGSLQMTFQTSVWRRCPAARPRAPIASIAQATNS